MRTGQQSRVMLCIWRQRTLTLSFQYVFSVSFLSCDHAIYGSNEAQTCTLES
jgi:hypothetical protein